MSRKPCAYRLDTYLDTPTCFSAVNTRVIGFQGRRRHVPPPLSFGVRVCGCRGYRWHLVTSTCSHPWPSPGPNGPIHSETVKAKKSPTDLQVRTDLVSCCCCCCCCCWWWWWWWLLLLSLLVVVVVRFIFHRKATRTKCPIE